MIQQMAASPQKLFSQQHFQRSERYVPLVALGDRKRCVPTPTAAPSTCERCTTAKKVDPQVQKTRQTLARERPSLNLVPMEKPNTEGSGPSVLQTQLVVHKSSVLWFCKVHGFTVILTLLYLS